MIHVVAIITAQPSPAQPGQRAALLAAFSANVPAVLAEDGCIDYVATIDAAGIPTSKGNVGPDTFVVVEKWASLDALRAHAVAPHMQAYAGKTKELLAGRVIHVLEPVGA